MVVVRKKKGESDDTLIHRFNKATKEANIKDEVEIRKRYIPKPKRRILKSKLRKQREAQRRRRNLGS